MEEFLWSMAVFLMVRPWMVALMGRASTQAPTRLQTAQPIRISQPG